MKYFFFFKISFLMMIIDPVSVLYMIDCGLSYSQVFIVSGFTRLAILLFEIPTGSVSDINGHKYSILFGVIAFGGGILFYIFYPVFTGFIAGSLFIGLSHSFLSGSSTAYLYETLKKDHNEENFSRVNGTMESAFFVMTALCSISAGYIYTYNNRLIFLIAFISSIISTLFLFKMDNIREESHNSLKNTYSKYLNNIKEGLKESLYNKKILMIMLYSVFMAFAISAVYETYQIYLKEIDIEKELFGWIYFILYMVSALFSKLAHHLKKKVGNGVLLTIFPLLLCLTAATMMTNHPVLLLFLINPRIIIGLYPTVINDILNREITKNRAIILSIRSLLIRAFQIFMIPLFGYLLDVYSLQTTFIIYIGFILLFTVTGVVIYHSKNSDKKFILKKKSG